MHAKTQVADDETEMKKFGRQRLRPTSTLTTFLWVKPNGNGHDNGKENRLKHGYNDNGTAYLRSHS
jgi:hypothetical protein